MTLKLRPNRRVSDALRQPTWDIFDDVGYTNHWIVEMPDGTFCLAYNDHGATKYCEPHPTKELALEHHQALLVADKLDGRGRPRRLDTTYTEEE